MKLSREGVTEKSAITDLKKLDIIMEGVVDN